MKKSAPKPFNGEYPKIPDRLAVIYVAVTMVIMAYSFLFKLFPILIFLGTWFAYLFYKKTFTLRPSADAMFVLAFPLLCCYSSLWSDTPSGTLYAGVGLFMMVSTTIIIARTVRTKAFAQGVSLGAMVTLLITLASGRYSLDYFSRAPSLTGFFGSKNEVGFFAEIGIYASMLLMFENIKIKEKFIFSFLPLLICAVSLYLCKSASSVASLIIACGVYFAMYLLTRLPKSFRWLALGAGMLSLITIILVIVSMDLNVFDPILKGFGKDSTLTGRTYLWSEGIKNGMKRPVLGYGYFAFWIPGRPEAEHYWQKFEIPGKTGFHFHNLFIQAFVDFGIVGLIYIVIFISLCIFKSIRLLIKEGMELEASLALGMSFLFLVRAFVEVDLFGPFGLGPLLYFSILPRLAMCR